MLQSQVQSLSSLPQTDFLTEIFSSPERVCPKSYPKENSLLRFSSGQQFLRAPLFCPNFFHQPRGFGVANKPDGLWLTYPGKEFMGQIGRASGSTGRPESQIQENKHRQKGYSEGAATENLSADIGHLTCLGHASCWHRESIWSQLVCLSPSKARQTPN